MGKAPAFQFYAAEYLADENVQLLSLEQEGAYIRLLAYCWREGSIPAEPLKLSRLCKGCDVEMLAGVLALFRPSELDGRLSHKWLDDEREKHESYRLKQAANGARGGRPSKHNPSQSETKGFGLLGVSQNEPKKGLLLLLLLRLPLQLKTKSKRLLSRSARLMQDTKNFETWRATTGITRILRSRCHGMPAKRSSSAACCRPILC